MILSIPHARICPGKSTRYPITNYDPILWLKTESSNYKLFNIDGFIVNNNQGVNGIFKKIEFLKENDDDDDEIHLNDILTVLPEEEIKLINNLSTILGCSFFTFIWPKDYPTGYNHQDPLINSFTFEENVNNLQIKSHRQLNLADMSRGIQMLRGFTFRNVKNLKSASSNLECHLANNTTNPWPGDIDALIFNIESQRYVAFIEFKTHNINTPIEEEHIGKYGAEDWRRFNVLFDLIDNFEEHQDYRPKLFFIVWGTNADYENHANVKIDLIERENIIDSQLFPRPEYNHPSADLFQFILNMANET